MSSGVLAPRLLGRRGRPEDGADDERGYPWATLPADTKSRKKSGGDETRRVSGAGSGVYEQGEPRCVEGECVGEGEVGGRGGREGGDELERSGDERGARKGSGERISGGRFKENC